MVVCGNGVGRVVRCDAFATRVQETLVGTFPRSEMKYSEAVSTS